jgi:tripartite-type tricarboxylate transporter receptor subunit TctC
MMGQLNRDQGQLFYCFNLVATYDFGLAVGSQIPAGSLRQFVAWVKTDTARAAFGGPSTGDLAHFLGALIGRAAGLDLRS